MPITWSSPGRFARAVKGFSVWGVVFSVWGSGSSVWGLGFCVWGVGTPLHKESYSWPLMGLPGSSK